MKEILARRLPLFERALRRLQEALAKPEDSIVRDACIQRFEFTFEIAWKTVRAYALGEGIECMSPRECFRTAFRLELIENDPGWMAMIEDRNRTSHTYDEESAKLIYRALPNYAGLLEALLRKLQSPRP
jgi:nucleotidyltransferase substrate binding protein (TIGR01987 family)